MSIRLHLPKDRDTYWVTSDWHSDAVHRKSLNNLFQKTKSIPFTDRKLIIAGDFLDVPYFFKKDTGYQAWRNHAKGCDEYFIPEFDKEVLWGNKTLDNLQAHFKDIYFLYGNHDQRIGYFRRSSYCPEPYKHYFKLDEKLELKERGISYGHYNDWIDIGKAVSITHGMYHAKTAPKKHYEAAHAKNVIFGHTHQYSVTPFVARGVTRYGINIGCMCSLNPEYMKNTETNWDNGFLELVVYKDKLDFKYHLTR